LIYHVNHEIRRTEGSEFIVDIGSGGEDSHFSELVGGVYRAAAGVGLDLNLGGRVVHWHRGQDYISADEETEDQREEEPVPPRQAPVEELPEVKLFLLGRANGDYLVVFHIRL